MDHQILEKGSEVGLQRFIVIADVAGGVPANYANLLAAYPPFVGAVQALPPANNPGPVPTMWTFATQHEATHFIVYMQQGVPGIRMLLLNNCPMAPVLF